MTLTHRLSRATVALLGGLSAAAATVAPALAGVPAGLANPIASASHGPATAAYVPGKVLVGYAPRPMLQPEAITAALAHRMGVSAVVAPAPSERILKLPPGQTVSQALALLRRQPGVAYAVPDYIAHVAGGTQKAGGWFPDDPGRTNRPGGWATMQWNFLAGAGVNAPEAWSNLRALRRPGAKGITIAVLDTGVAYRNWRTFKALPDFDHTHFVAPYDFVAGDGYPLDRDGHGTFVTGILAASTGNGLGLTGLAYGASIMPVRVLGSDGTGDAGTIARGIRYAVDRHAQVINLSLEFSLDVAPGDIPDIISAIRYAHQRGVVVVGAAGNEGVAQVAYPARAAFVISVGATTRDRCLANYSNDGSRLDLVAPGGNDDTAQLSDPNCHYTRSLPDISQMTFYDPSNPNRFGYPGGWYGTSMSAPHVAAAVALVMASGVIGPHPSPEAILSRLELTAQTLGGAKPNRSYGYGLLNVGAATSPAPTARRR